MTILAPCFANSRTMAIPIPLLPPVTMATFPLRLIVISPLQLMVDSTKLHGDGRRRGVRGGGGGAHNALRSSSTHGGPQAGLPGHRGPDTRTRARRARTRIVVEHRPRTDRR